MTWMRDADGRRVCSMHFPCSFGFRFFCYENSAPDSVNSPEGAMNRFRCFPPEPTIVADRPKLFGRQNRVAAPFHDVVVSPSQRDLVPREDPRSFPSPVLGLTASRGG